MKYNLNEIKKDQNTFQKINNSCYHDFLEQYIFNFYDYLFMIYFTKTPNYIENCIKSNNNQEDVNLFPKLFLEFKNNENKKEKN